MNIFYFSGAKLPSNDAHSVHIMKMAQAFAKAGHDVTLFTKGINNATTSDLFKIYDTQPIFKIIQSSYMGIPFIGNKMRLLTRTANDNQKTPDLIFGHDLSTLSLLRKRNIPIIFEAHQMPSGSTQHIAFLQLIRSRNLKAIVAVSDILKREILAKYTALEPEMIFVAPDGADLIDHIAANEHDTDILRGRKNAYNVGYAGSLHPGKGLAMITRIAKLRPEYDFHILGGSQKQVQKLETANTLKNIYFYGHRDHADVPKYLKAFDVAVAPYQHRALIKTGRNISRWISPMKVFEYMAAQKPVLCSDLPVLQNILKHDHNALLLPASNEAKWASAIDMLKDNPDHAHRLAMNAHESLKNHYTWDKRAEAVLDVYHVGRLNLRALSS